MTQSARIQEFLSRSAARLGRWYGPSCAIAGACVASAVWAVAVSSSRTQVESARGTVVTMVDADGQFLDAPSEMLVTDLLPQQATCAADEFRPLHEREDYCVEPPDILHIDVSCEGAAYQTFVSSMTTEYLVAPDGAIDLGGQFGGVLVAGKTLREIEETVEHRLEGADCRPQVSASVFAQNSHVYYVISQRPDGSDQVHRCPVVGNETVRDAVGQIGELEDLAQKSIWITRPQTDGAGVDSILPVNWQEVLTDSSAASNHRILTGDRVFVEENGLLALDQILNRAVDQVTLPFRQLLGLGAPQHEECCPCQAAGQEQERD